MTSTTNRFLASAVRAGDIVINTIDPLSPHLKVDFQLLEDSGRVLGRTSYQGQDGWPQDVLDAVVNLRTRLEAFAIQAFFDTPATIPTPPPSTPPPEPEQF